MDATLSVYSRAFIRHDNMKQPIYAASALIVLLSKGVKIFDIVEMYYDIEKFFWYITYRKNVNIQNVELVAEDESGKLTLVGNLCFTKKVISELSDDRKTRIIDARFLGGKTSKILSIIRKGKIKFDHIPESLKSGNEYTVPRMLMILTGFEREYDNIYGKESLRSRESLEAKGAVLEMLKRLRREAPSKQKDYYKRLIKSLNDYDHSFTNRVERAFIDCKHIMEPFIKNHYYDRQNRSIKRISKRIGILRNGFAHCRPDLKIKEINLEDIKMVERLIYVLRLKTMGFNDTDCQYAVASLFKESIHNPNTRVTGLPI